jgi:hypothetical protein
MIHPVNSFIAIAPVTHPEAQSFCSLVNPRGNPYREIRRSFGRIAARPPQMGATAAPVRHATGDFRALV